jgi:uncharacterized membrane protein YjgN (DUF898 family)
LLAIFYILAQFGAYRARRYQVSRTIFRGIRFWMTGSGWGYAGRKVLWDLASLLSLGLVYPWAVASLERYRMRHTYFGSLQGNFVGTGLSLFKQIWWLWPIGIGLTALVGYLLSANASPAAPIFLLMWIIGAASLWIVLFSIRLRWQIEGVRFAEIVLSSNLAPGRMIGLYAGTLFWFFVVVLVFGAGAALFAVLRLEGVIDPKASFGWQSFVTIVIVIMIGGYLLLAIALSVVHRYFLTRGFWALVAGSITVANLDAIEQAKAAGQPSGSLGEGLADALDFGRGF